jgi:hemolysin-type calcium binding domain protein
MLGISNSGDVASLAYNINNIVFSELIIKYNGNTEEIKKALNKPINLKGAFGILGISTVFGVASFSDIKLDDFSGASIDKYHPKPNKNWAAFWLKTLATGAASIAVGGWNIGGIGTKIFAGVSVDAIFKKVYDGVIGPHVMTIDFTKTPDPNDTVAMERKYIVREGSLEDTLKHNWNHINSDMKNLERVIVSTEDLGKSNIIYYRENKQESILNDTLYLEKWNTKSEANLISFLKRFGTDFLPKIKRGGYDQDPKKLVANYFANFGAEASRVSSDLQKDDKKLAAAYALEHLAGYVLEDHKAPNEYTELEQYSQQHLRDRAEFLTVKIKTASGSNDRSISKMFYDQRTGERISGDAPAKFGLQKNLVAFVDGKYKVAYQSSLRTIYGYSNDDTIESTWISNNYIESGLGSDTIITGSGNDTIYTNAAIDGKYDQEDNSVKNTVHAGAGDDTVYGSKGMDEIYGEGGSDTIYGGGGDDIIYGGEDNDTLYADNAARGSIDTSSNINKLYGGQGDDTIIGGAGKDYLYANDEKGDSPENHMTNDSPDGKEGDDFLYGNTAKQSRTIMQGGTGNDTFYGGQGGIDTMNDEEGDNTYYAGDWDTIDDSDGKGKVFFGNELLKGGMYDKEKRAYVDRNNPKITYKLSEGEKILTVYKGIEKLKIKNYHKEDKSLGIKLANSKIEVSVINKEGSANWLKESLGDTGLPFTLSLNRRLDKGEYLKVEVVSSIQGDKSIIEFKEGDISKDFNFTWKDDNYPQGNRYFAVNAYVVEESSDLTAEVVSNARGMIKDDDRNPDNPNNPNYPNNPDVPTDPNDPQNAPMYYDPIIIDLNKDGTTTSKLNGAVNFDIDNNGFKEATGWISKDDAFLAYDRNGNGKIDNGNELFGNHTVSNTIYGYTDDKAVNGYKFFKMFPFEIIIRNDNLNLIAV